MNFWDLLRDPLHGDGYQWWSGLGADLGLLGAAVAVLRKRNCHVKRCWRIGRFPVEGTPYVVCQAHHPDEHPKHYAPEPQDIVDHADRL